MTAARRITSQDESQFADVIEQINYLTARLERATHHLREVLDDTREHIEDEEGDGHA